MQIHYQIKSWKEIIYFISAEPENYRCACSAKAQARRHNTTPLDLSLANEETQNDERTGTTGGGKARKERQDRHPDAYLHSFAAIMCMLPMHTTLDRLSEQKSERIWTFLTATTTLLMHASIKLKRDFRITR